MSCSTPKYVSEEELIEYIREDSNGLIKKQTSGPINLTLQYRPTDLLVKQEVTDYQGTASINKARNKYQGYAYFILSIDMNGSNALYGASTDMTAFSENLQTLSFRMGDKVDIITSNQDTIAVADYIFDRTYGMGSTNLMFVFDREKINESETFTFRLKDFGMRTGDQRFKFKSSHLSKTPQLEELQVKS